EGMKEAAFQVHLRDARARRAVEESTARKLEHLSFLQALAGALASDTRLSVILERALDVCMQRRGAGPIPVFRAVESAMQCVAARGGAPPDADAAPSSEDELGELAVSTGGWSLALPLSHARRRVGMLVVRGHPNAMLSDAERGLWSSVSSAI